MITLIKCDRHLKDDMHESWVIPNDFQNGVNLYGAPFILPEVMCLQMLNGRFPNIFHKSKIVQASTVLIYSILFVHSKGIKQT